VRRLFPVMDGGFLLQIGQLGIPELFG
jgi:hypothetical protein